MNRARDTFGNHDSQQHVRYVEVYTIDATGLQPVLVKNLKWISGTSLYQPFGAPFRIGSASTAANVSTEDRLWVVYRRDSKRWEPVTAGDAGDFPIVKVKNVSGLPRAVGSIVGLGVPLTAPPGTITRFGVFNSAAPTNGLVFVVLLSDAAVNAIVDAAIVGAVATQINFTDAAHKFADAITNDYAKLASAGSGPVRIIWRQQQHILGPGSLGVQWAMVELGLSVPTIESPRAVVYSEIAKASGNRDGPLTPGTGLVRRYLPPTGPAGTPWQPGSTMLVETWMHAKSVIGKPMLLRESRKLPDGSPLYELTAEGCGVVPVTGSTD